MNAKSMAPDPRPALAAAQDLIRIDTEVLIEEQPARVHAYASNASRWHEWHPATRSVEALPDRPLSMGESIVEHIRAGGRRFTATWTVIACEPPLVWMIATDTAQGLARITYTLAPVDTGTAAVTRFHRRLECRSKGWLRWLDPLLMPVTLVPQSRRALANLKARIEQLRA